MNEIRRVLKKDGIVVIVQNTLANKSKMHTERYRQYVAKELGRSYLDTNHRFNIENYTNYITGFRILKEERMFGYFISPDPGPLIDYISSMKDFYVPIPKKEEWNEVINKLKILITREISGKKLFEEVVGTGMVLLQKV